MSAQDFKANYSFLYEAALPAESTIKADLEYITYHWADLSYDPWEESNGYGQFFNTISFREALQYGHELANALGDSGADDWYQLHLSEVNNFLEDFWDAKAGYIKSTIGHQNGVEWKKKHLDSSVLIAVLLASRTAPDDPYSLCILTLYHQLIQILIASCRRLSRLMLRLRRSIPSTGANFHHVSVGTKKIFTMAMGFPGVIHGS